MEANHFNDVRMRLAALNIVEGEEITPELVDQFREVIADVQRTASAVFTAKAQDALVEKAKVDGGLLAGVLNEAIADAGLDPDAERRLRAALRKAILHAGEEPRRAVEPFSPPASSFG